MKLVMMSGKQDMTKLKGAKMNRKEYEDRIKAIIVKVSALTKKTKELNTYLESRGMYKKNTIIVKLKENK